MTCTILRAVPWWVAGALGRRYGARMTDIETQSQRQSPGRIGRVGGRLAAAGFVFFLAKGLLWLAVAAVLGLAGRGAVTG